MDYVGALGIVTVAYVMFTIGTVHKKFRKTSRGPWTGFMVRGSLTSSKSKSENNFSLFGFKIIFMIHEK